MAIHVHEQGVRGRAFLWGGIGAGALFLVLLLTHGFGLPGGSSGGPREAPLLVRPSIQASVRCVPSHKGPVRVFLQTQNHSFRDSVGMYFSGENWLPLCEPSQKGCVALRPQRHHQ